MEFTSARTSLRLKNLLRRKYISLSSHNNLDEVLFSNSLDNTIIPNPMIDNNRIRSNKITTSPNLNLNHTRSNLNVRNEKQSLDVNNLELNNIETLFPSLKMIIKDLFDLYRVDKDPRSNPRLERNSELINYVQLLFQKCI